MKETAVVFGATGLVGSTLVETLLLDSRFERVVAVSRTVLPVSHPALEQLLLTDFSELPRYADQLQASVYFCCIGTTRKKTRDLTAYRRIDLGIPCHVAQLAEKLAVPTLVVVSSIGASVHASTFYLRTKGDMEMAVRSIYHGRLTFVRPSLLMGNRPEFRFAERVSVVIMALLGWMFVGKSAKYRGIHVRQVAKAMIQASHLPVIDPIYETHELVLLAKGLPTAVVRNPLAVHKKINGWLIVFFFSLVAVAVIVGHRQRLYHERLLGDLPEMQARGELRALTLYSSASYFIYRDKEMGYEYELCSQLAASLGLKLRMIVVPNSLALMDSLNAGVGDVVAYNVPLTNAIKRSYIPCGREFLTHQVLIQRRDSPRRIVSVTDLIDKEIVVQQGTPFHTRLTHLNDELGGGIRIKALADDSLTTEDLIGQVATGQIAYTVADNVLAQFNKTYYKNLYTSTTLGFPQHAFWLVRKGSPLLAAAISHWFSTNATSSTYKAINKRYFESSKGPSPFLTTGRFVGTGGRLSPYDQLFKRHASKHGLDWRLLVSIGYQESKFDTLAVSWAGAVGLMQLMPNTARAFGVDASNLTDPENNILAASRLLRSLHRNFAGVPDLEDRSKLVLAAFNCGLGHVKDARALAKKYNKNPNLWSDVSSFLSLKRLPKYYDDPVCKQGYLRGTETAAFVTEVWARYRYYIEKGVKP